MKKSQNLARRTSLPSEICEFSPFHNLPPLTHLDVKLSEVAVGLTAAMVSKGLNRTALAEKIGWKKSRLSNVLSGKCNLTLRTINEVTSTLGLDYDIVFREHSAPRPRQVWESMAEKHLSYVTGHTKDTICMAMKSPHEVAVDLVSGNAADIYLSIKFPDTHIQSFLVESHDSQKPLESKPLPWNSDLTISQPIPLKFNNAESVYE